MYAHERTASERRGNRRRRGNDLRDNGTPIPEELEHWGLGPAEALNRVVLDTLRPVTLGFTLVYVVFAAFAWLTMPEQARASMLVSQSVMAAAFLIAHLALVKGRVPGRYANPVAAVLVVLALANVVLAFSLLGEPFYVFLYTSYVLMMLLALGFLLMSTRWLVASIVLITSVWTVALWARAEPGVLVHLVLAMGAATVLAMVIHTSRLRTHRRLLEAVVLAVRESEERAQAEAVQSVQFEISRAVGESESLYELMEIVHEQLGRLVDTTNFYLALYDDESDTYSFPYHVDEYDQATGIPPQQLRKSLTDYVRRTGEPLFVTQDVHERLEAAGEVMLVGTPSPYWLGVPLETSEGVIGVLTVQSYSEDVPYTAADLELLTFVSGNIALAVERKRAEESLQLTQFAVDHAVDAMYWMDNTGRFFYVNDAACRTLGYTQDELLTMHVYDIDPNFPADRWQEFWDLLKRERNLTLETVHIAKDDRQVPVEISGNFLEYEGGEYNCAFAWDITERKRSEAALRRSEEKFRSLFEDSRDAIFISTPDGVIDDANMAAVRLFGYRSKDEFLGIEMARDLFQERGQSDRFLQQLADDGFVKDYELALRTRQGRKLQVVATATEARDPEGRVVGYRGILRDVTDRRALERQLRHSQKMEAVGQLAGGVAHDFNNLLTGIQGFTQLALGRLDPDSSESGDLRKALEMSDQAATLTRQLLAFSSRQPLEPRVLNLNSLIEDTLKMLKRLIGEGVRLRFLPAADLGNARVDPGQIELVLFNLTINARDAMPDGGVLTFETANAVLDEVHCSTRPGVEPGAYVLVAATDTGVGMDVDTQRHIFEPFFTTKDVGDGTGLGLATLYGIVDQHGGHVEVESTPGEGSTFRIYFPVVAQEAEGVSAKSALGLAPRGTETILLVEDEDAVRAVARRGLEMLGYQVYEAAHPREAEGLFARHGAEIDLLLTDVVMPEMNGPTLHQRLSKHRNTLRVLFMSGYPQDAVSENGALAPDKPFIPKPFTPAQLAEKVRQVLAE